MVKVFTPSNKDSVSTRNVSTTTEDRARDLAQFKEKRAEQEQLKQERFNKIRNRRKGRPGGGGGINLEITSD